MTSPPLLSVENLIKTYNGVTAVDGISFDIPGGTCFGLLGPNGAGKTTTIEIMENILDQDAGHVRYKGKQRTARFNQDIGIQFQQTQLMGYLTVAETLSTFAAFYDSPLAPEKVIALCQLDDIRDRMNDKISGGSASACFSGLPWSMTPGWSFLTNPPPALIPSPV